MEDCEGKPDKTVSALNKLKNIDNVKFNIGPGISSCMLAAAPVAERSKILMMGTTCENSKISQAGDYIFRVYPSYQIHGKALAEFARNEWGLRKAAIIFVNNDFGIDISKEFTSTFESLGGTVLIQESYIEGEKDFRTSLTKIKNKEPEVLFLSSYIREMPTILIQAKELGLQCKFVASSSFYDQKVLDLAGSTAEGVAASTSLYDVNSNDSPVVKYVTEYNARYGQKPDYWSSYGYDAANMLITGIEAVGPEPEKVKNHFYSMPPKSGVTGMLSFDKNGDIITDVRIVIVKNGKFETVKIVKKREK
jgi:branched-chain amino acid transport system substrate-binding protein